VRTIVALLVVSQIICGGTAAQDRATTPAAPSLQRVRERLLSAPTTVILEPTSADVRPRYRVRVDGQRPLLVTAPWQPDTIVPSYVRTRAPVYHHEFLAMVTPEDFRAPTLYPGMIGLDVVPLLQALSGKISRGSTKDRERRARLQVKKELEAFLLTVPKPKP
jgi:hypothetical protein